jgi:hypothetical protein
MDEKTKYEQAIDTHLRETEQDDAEFLEYFNEEYGSLTENNRQLMEVQYRQRLRAIRRDPALMSALKRRGMSAEKFAQLSDKNPNAYPEVYHQGVEQLLDRLEGKGPKRPDAFFDAAASLKPHPKNVEKAREVAKSGKGDDKMIDDLISALMYGD